jgi:hypothetical protein
MKVGDLARFDLDEDAVVGVFSNLDLELLYASVQLTTHSWKTWIREDALPRGLDIEDGHKVVANLTSLERKLGDWLGVVEESKE